MQEKFKIMVDEVAFKNKPQGKDIGEIQNFFKTEEAIKELTIEEFLMSVKNGYTYYPALTKDIEKGTKNDNWKEQQLIAIDVDSSDDNIITIEETMDKLRDKWIKPFSYYESFHNTKEKPKFRVLFLLNQPTNEADKIKTAIENLIKITGGDEACKNLGRIYFGTNGEKQEVKLLDQNARVSLEELVNLYQSCDSNVTNSKEKDNTDNNKDNNDLNSLIKNFDLFSYMTKDNNNYYTSGNITYFNHCHICGHNDCLRYFHDSNQYQCFSSDDETRGNIIDYIMATKDLSHKEAVRYFIKEILKMELKKPVKNYLDVVKSQVEEIGLDNNGINSCPYIKEDGKISCPLLAEFIRNNLNYIFVRNEATEGVLRYYYIDGYYKLMSDEEMNGLIKSLIPLELQSSKIYNEVRKLLYSDLKYVRMKELNSNENIINFNNGILHLDTMELKSHSPRYLSTIRIPCDFVEEVTTPENSYFEKYLDDLTEKDEELKQLLLEIIGLTISNVKGYRTKKALFMVGKGDTGKSQIKVFLKKLLGDENTSEIDLKQLEDKFGKSQLLDKRLVGSNDMGYITIPALTVFKQATGGDPIYMEQKFMNGFSCTFNGFMWFCCNALPKFGGDKEDWVYNRILIIECNNVIPVDKQDKDLVKHLLEEKDYIVSLSIKALKRLIENNYKFDIPEKCLKANKDYQMDNNSFLKFFNECTIERVPRVAIKDNCTKGKIFEVYKAWCKDNNKGYTEAKGEVKRLLEKMGKNTTIKTNGGKEYYVDFTLKDEVKLEYSEVYGLYDGVTEDDVSTQSEKEIIYEEFDF